MILGDSIAKQIADIERDVFSDAWSYETITHTFLMKHYHIYVAYSGDDDKGIIELDENKAGMNCDELGIGEITGYIIASVIADETELLRIAVKDEYRKQGFASLLIGKYLSDMKECATTGFLEVRESNTSAKALYEKNGYRQIGIRRRYYKEPEEDACIYQISF